MKIRLDRLLVERGLAPTREKAQAMILAGLVTVGGRRVEKAGEGVPSDAEVEVAGPPHPYVSRGGVKLAGALDHFGIDPRGKVCLDVGASTGGFTDCLLQRGAARVYAVDVGYGQLDAKLRNDARVVVREKVNARALSAAEVGEPIELAAVDVSFISLRLVLPAIASTLAPVPGGVPIIALVKPQFEVGKGGTDHGVVRDPEAHRAVLRRIVEIATGLDRKSVV